MFYFYSTQQSQANISYFKGLLFEDLLRQYLKAAGYQVDLTRRKEASLEYDLHGLHSIDGRGVIGEAKAHNDTIGGSELAAFVGKALPFFHRKDPYSGLFLSISPLSPDAEDYLRSLKSTTPYSINRICGTDLEQQIRSSLNLPSKDRTEALVTDAIPYRSAQHLLHSDRGTFIVLMGSGKDSSFDDRFTMISASGEIVDDPILIRGIQESVQALQELEYIKTPALPSTKQTLNPDRNIPSGLITASDWLDYRRPAGERYFVGREDALQRAELILTEAKDGQIIEVKSRSGVGKSSLLSILESRWKANDYITELHDARDVQSASDVFALIQRFTRSKTRITSFESIGTALEELNKDIAGTRAIFMVDQFESTFLSPEVYYAYEYLALCIARGAAHQTMIFTRKDDLLTTHDEIVVNLDRLRSLSQPISLDDFSRDEAHNLLNQIATAYPRRLSTRILAQVLEFAQGFPWLLKRTMAHVASMINKGVNQQEMLSSGLHLEDLFEEEVAELDEHERGYLTRLAAVLPATYQALARRFEDDPFLREMLGKLTSRRLLRFSAGTYDTYNDVFKDFLLYERLPERSQSQIFRLGLVSVMQSFQALRGVNQIEPEKLADLLGKSLGGTYNLLRELRLAGLITRTQSGWSVPEVVRQYEHQGRLGEYVRQSILKNRVVSELLAELEKSGKFPRRNLTPWLQHHFPFVEAKSIVWSQYSNRLIDWLQRLRLIKTQGDLLLPISDDKEQILRDLGNLKIAGRGSRPAKAAFVPSVAWSTISRTLAQLSSTGHLATSRRSDKMAELDLRKLGALTSYVGELIPLWTVSQLESHARNLLSAEPYTRYWYLLRLGVRWEDALTQAFGLGDLAPSTRKAIGKKLANWGRNFGFLPKGKIVTVGSSRPDSQNGELDIE